MHLSYLGLEPCTHHRSKFSGTRTQTCPLLHHIVFIVPFSVSLMWICIFRSSKCYLSVPLMLISQHFQETADEENLTKPEWFDSGRKQSHQMTKPYWSVWFCLCLFESFALECTWLPNTVNKSPLICCWEATYSSLRMADFSTTLSCLSSVVVGGRSVFVRRGIGDRVVMAEWGCPGSNSWFTCNMGLSFSHIGIAIIFNACIRKSQSEKPLMVSVFLMHTNRTQNQCHSCRTAFTFLERRLGNTKIQNRVCSCRGSLQWNAINNRSSRW